MAVVQVAIHVLVGPHGQRLIEEGLVDDLGGGVQLHHAHAPVDGGRDVALEANAAVQGDVLCEVHIFILIVAARGIWTGAQHTHS